MPLASVGVPWHKRFTFYDQVHTTGMDIKQCGTARAAITVSKDTNILRDYAQGAWRMRGIGVGQVRHGVSISSPLDCHAAHSEAATHVGEARERVGARRSVGT